MILLVTVTLPRQARARSALLDPTVMTINLKTRGKRACRRRSGVVPCTVLGECLITPWHAVREKEHNSKITTPQRNLRSFRWGLLQAEIESSVETQRD